MEFLGKSDIGSVRTNNEDVFATVEDLGYCLVADGMGGAAAGEIASGIFAQITEKVFSGILSFSEDQAIERVQTVFRLANNKILEHVELNPDHKGMGCTAELITFSNDRFILGHVGDSRTYRLRNGEFKQLTKDHSLVQEQIDRGVITPDQARKHSMRNVILRAVGVNESVALDVLRGKLAKDDLFLICSDGLTDMVEDERIKALLNQGLPLDITTEHLIQEAKKAGGRDNITIVLIKV